MKKLPEGHIDRYDWSHATRGRLAARIAAEGSNLCALDEDVAEGFPDSAAVNAALEGESLIVEPGAYAPFTTDGKSVLEYRIKVRW